MKITLKRCTMMTVWGIGFGGWKEDSDVHLAEVQEKYCALHLKTWIWDLITRIWILMSCLKVCLECLLVFASCRGWNEHVITLTYSKHHKFYSCSVAIINIRIALDNLHNIFTHSTSLDPYLIRYYCHARFTHAKWRLNRLNALLGVT